MQRVRVGLTGLACVFLLVLLAAAFFGLVRREPDVEGTSATMHAAGGAGNSTKSSPKEPLAELGVTPGNLPDQPVPVLSPAPPPPPPATATTAE